MLSRSIFPALMVVVVGIWIVGLPAEEGQRESTSVSAAGPEIKALQAQRRTVLKKRVEAVRSEFKSGRTDVAFLLDAEADSWRAELDLCTTKKTRIAAHKKFVANTAEAERVANLNLENGTGTSQQQLAAKAAWIEAKIALLQEQAKE